VQIIICMMGSCFRINSGPQLDKRAQSVRLKGRGGEGSNILHAVH
jgi:hypothetical protein